MQHVTNKCTPKYVAGGLIDSHCHLQHLDQEQLPAIFKRAQQNEVRGILNVGIKAFDALSVTPPQSLNYLDLPLIKLWYSIGVHPSHVTEFEVAAITQEMLQKYHDLDTKQTPIIAIGETGLDSSITTASLEQQLNMFVAQVALAKQLDLPLIIHTREVDEMMIDCIKQLKLTNAVLHCFTGKKELLKAALDAGIYISISGIITFKNNTNVLEALNYLPLDKLLIETDAPYLAPSPHRGKRNEPSYLLHTAEAIRSIRKLSAIQLNEIIERNFFELFKKA